MSKYSKKLRESFGDDKDVALELMLFWIGSMLTLVVVLMLFGMCSG